MNKKTLSNVQLELLKLYSTNLQSDDLIELKQHLAKYFAKKAIIGADAIWDANNLSNSNMDKILNEEKAQSYT